MVRMAWLTINARERSTLLLVEMWADTKYAQCFHAALVLKDASWSLWRAKGANIERHQTLAT